MKKSSDGKSGNAAPKPMRVSRFVAAMACFATLAGVAGFVSGPAFAQAYPNKAIRIVVPWPAGGASDSVGRVMAQRLSERMSAPVIVENRAGAAGTIGAEAVARAPADGYTLLLASAETHAIAPNMRSKLSYEPLKDFVAIMPFAINPFALVARPDFPANTTRELLALIKSQPGKFTYSSAGLGSTSQIAMETFKGLAGLNILHVPFQGQAPAITSLLGGQTDLQMLPAGSAATLRKAGKLKVFAVSTHGRFFDMPDVSTLREEITTVRVVAPDTPSAVGAAWYPSKTEIRPTATPKTMALKRPLSTSWRKSTLACICDQKAPESMPISSTPIR